MKRKIVKNQLRKFRRLADLTQEQLAKMAQTRQPYISDWERARWRPSEKMKQRLSSLLNLPIEVIFPEDENRRE